MIDVGVDALERSRADRLLAQPRSHRWIFNDVELAVAAQLGEERRLEWLAGRFSAKEAVAKVIQYSGGHGSRWREIEVLGPGAPVVRLSGDVARAAADRGIDTVRVSLSHQPSVVVAVAIGLGAPAPCACTVTA